MTVEPECAFPALAATTGYSKGCRCDRCVTAGKEAGARWLQKHRRPRAPKPDQSQESWYSLNRDRVRAERAAAGQIASADEIELALRKDIAPRFVRGRFSEAEDRVIIAWRGTDLMLAVALGRTYDAVIGRKHRLRIEGRLWQ